MGVMGTDCTGSYKVARSHKKGELVNTKQKESAKQSRNVHSGKPKLRHRQQGFLPQTSLVLSATGSLELRLVSSAILEHTNNNTSHSSLGLVTVSNDRRTKKIYLSICLSIYLSSYLSRAPSKPPFKTLTYQQSHGNRLHRIVQSGEVS